MSTTRIRQLADDLHSLHVGLRHDVSTCIASTRDLPGGAIVVICKERLHRADHVAITAQLLREASHSLLAFYSGSAAAALPAEKQYVSPYSADLQTLKSIPRSAYTIPWECALRVSCLTAETDPERHAQETAFVITHAARQVPLVDIARKGIERLGGDVFLDQPDIAAIPSWGGRILFLISQLLAEEPPEYRQAHLAKRQHIPDHQAGHVGQIVRRGKTSIDLRIGRVEIDQGGSRISLRYDGKLHTIARSVDHDMGKDRDRRIAQVFHPAPCEMEAV